MIAGRKISWASAMVLRSGQKLAFSVVRPVSRIHTSTVLARGEYQKFSPRPGIKELQVMNEAYDGIYDEFRRERSRGDDSAKKDFRGNDSARGDFRRNDSARGGYRRNDSAEGGGFRRNDSAKGGYRRNDSAEGGFRRNDSAEGGYRRNESAKGGYRKGGQRGKGRGANRRDRDSFEDQDKVISRNKTTNSGREGDGLLGLDDYEVDIVKLKDMEWTDLIPKIDETTNDAGENDSGSSTSTAGFSDVPTLALAEHKIVSRVLVNSLHYNRKYSQLTPVQAQTIIPILKNESVVVRAKTGTGKTAAFAIPTLQKVLEARRRGEQGVKAVIVSPTRELAQQIADEITAISAYGELRNIRTQCFVGGLSKDKQLKLGFLKKPVVDIVVATPGRLLDILEDDSVLKNFSGLQFKVFDEADRLLDIGFRDSLGQIRDRLATVVKHQVPTLLFSATIDKTVRSFAKDEFGEKAKVVDTVPKDEPGAAELVLQQALVCNNWAHMYSAGVHSVEQEADIASKAKEDGTLPVPFKAIVFLPSVILVEHFAAVLRRYFAKHSDRRNFVHTIHGKMTQANRQRVADTYRKARESILVTTDVVARGMDFPHVSHVFQIGIPQDVASYIHRIGRTARIGNSGKSMLILSKYELGYLNKLEESNILMQEQSNYAPHEDVHEKLTEIFPDTVADEEEANNIYNNVLISVGSLKRTYRIDGRKYLRDHESFGHLLGLDTPILSSVARKVWYDQRDVFIRSRSGRGSFQGGSRQSRMKW
jgi:ATP-dependent RNA helicase MSS116